MSLESFLSYYKGQRFNRKDEIKTMTKRILSLVMALAMVLTMVPAFAATCEHNHNEPKACDVVKIGDGVHYYVCECDAVINDGAGYAHDFEWNEFGYAYCPTCGWEADVVGCAGKGETCDTADYVVTETGHKTACSKCGIETKGVEEVAHTYVKKPTGAVCVCGATEACEHSYAWLDMKEEGCFQYCTKCGYRPLGDRVPHEWEYSQLEGETGKTYHLIACKNCGNSQGGQSHSSFLVKNEDGTTKWYTDGENHWNVCSACDAIVDKAAHTLQWVPADEGIKQHCTTCGLVAAACADHVATGANVATCEKFAVCDNCGKEMTDKPKADHVWESLVNLGSKHGSVCVICGTRKADQVDHKYVLVGSDAICVCGAKVEDCDHNWVDRAAEKADCKTNTSGLTKGVQCSDCGTWKVEQTIITGEHTELKEVYVPATCFVDGTMKHTCTVCGNVRFTTIECETDPLAHNLVYVKVAKEATCVDKGEEMWQCTNTACTYAKGNTAGKYFPVAIAAKGHVQTQIKVDYVDGKLSDELNCQGGIYSYTGCENCSYMLSKITLIPNSEYPDHNLVKIDKVAATCTTPAGTLYACSNNDCEYEVIKDADGNELSGSDYHNVAAGVIVHETPATCTEKGSKWYQCPTCGVQIAPAKRVDNATGSNWVDSDEVFTIKALGHTMDNVKTTDATCQDFGYTETTCSVCGGNYTKTINYTAGLAECSYVKGAALTEEVCGKDADYTMVCKWCGEYKLDGNKEQAVESKPVEHKYEMVGEPLVVGKTCPESDWGAGVCARCGDKQPYMEFKPSAKEAAHEWVLASMPATCEAPATKGYFCVKCGIVDETRKPQTEGEKLDHVWDNGELIEYCGKDDVIYSVCTLCGAEKYQEAGAAEPFTPAADDHAATSLKPYILVKATCESKGLQIEEYCKDCGYITINNIQPYGTGDHVAKTGTYKTYKDCTGSYETFTCSECNLKIDRLLEDEDGKVKDANNHRASTYELIKPFTCTESGFGYEACTACGYKAEKPATIEAQHVWAKDAVVIKAPTCGDDGYGKVVCTVCGQEDTDDNGQVYFVTIPKTEKHTFAEYILESGNCKYKSYVIYECSVCGGAADPDTLKKAGYADYIPNPVFSYLDTVNNVMVEDNNKAKNAVEIVDFDGKHDLGTPYKAEATCNEAAGIAQDCKVCGMKVMMSTTGNALGHDPIYTTVKATCYVDGVKTGTCYRCGKVVSEEVLPATNHSMKAVANDVRNVAATCGTKGIAVTACEACGYEELTVTDYNKKNHEYEAIKVYTAADCKTGTTGLVYEQCVKCGDTGVHTVAPAHKYVDTAVKQEAKCDVAGIMIQTCSVCEKATREVSIPKTAHVMITKEQAATCLLPAGTITRCANCDLVTSFVRTGSTALTHKWSAKVWVAPTCTSAGGYEVVCLREGCTAKDFDKSTADADKALNHKGKVLVDEIAATCQSPAYAIYNCPICKEEITEITAPINVQKGHKWEITSYYNYEPTCAKAGFVDRKCALCGVTGNRVWHTPEHKMSEMVTGNGIFYTFCTGCGLMDVKYVAENFAGYNGCTTITVDANGNKTVTGTHKGLVVKAGKEATCTEAGQIEHIECTVCGTVIQQGAEVPAHTVTKIEAKAATCTEAGSTAGEYCEVCKKYIVEVKTVEALGHTVVEVPAVDATATTAGTTAGKKCSVCNEILEGCEPVAKLGATVKRLCVVRSKAADYREDATSEVVKMLAEGTAVVITGELVNEYYPVEGGYIHMSYITVA